MTETPPKIFPPLADEQEEMRRLNACAIHAAENLDTMSGAWFLHLVIHFGGGAYEYLVEAGRDPATMEEIEYRLGAFGVRERLYERFLREVRLEIVQ